MNYYRDKDYKYFSRNKNVQRYDILVTQMYEVIVDIEKNKSKYAGEWAEERKDLEKNIDALLEQGKTPKKGNKKDN